MDYINNHEIVQKISYKIQAATGTRFQTLVGVVFTEYYKTLNKDFEMPYAGGGDDKNDGWVKNDALFYQIYAPETYNGYNNSFIRNIRSKFEEDLTGLVELIVEEDKWLGEIKEFIYIINTFDNNLPKDSDDYYNTIKKQLCTKYSIDFSVRVVNIEYIKDILLSINDSKVLSNILFKCDLIPPKNFEYSTGIIINVLRRISGYINSLVISTNEVEDGYQRMSTVDKIHLNKLDDIKEPIESAIDRLYYIENAIEIIFNQDIKLSKQFENVTNYIVTLYNDNKEVYKGPEMFNYIQSKIVPDDNDNEGLTYISFLLIVYVFDLCEIFEKEVNYHDITE